MALAWLLGRPGVCTLVIGVRSEEQLAANLAAAELQLSADECARLEQVSAPPLLYPYWHQAKTAADRLEPRRPRPARPTPVTRWRMAARPEG